MLKTLIDKLISIRNKIRIGSKYNQISQARAVAERSPLAFRVLRHNAELMKGKAATSGNLDLNPVVSSVQMEPASGTSELAEGETFKLEIQVLGSMLGRFELEVDHSLGEMPEFSVYADESDPYGGDKSQFEDVGVTVEYSNGKFNIDLGSQITQLIASKPEVKFYYAVRDYSGKYLWGSMNPTSPENTRTYTVVIN